MSKKLPEHLPNTFALVTTELIRGQPPHVQVLYMRLSKYANYQTKKCRPSVETLAEDTGTSKSTVLRAIKTLEELNLIKKKNRFDKGRQSSNEYHVYRL